MTQESCGICQKLKWNRLGTVQHAQLKRGKEEGKSYKGNHTGGEENSRSDREGGIKKDQCAAFDTEKTTEAGGE